MVTFHMASQGISYIYTYYMELLHGIVYIFEVPTEIV